MAETAKRAALATLVVGGVVVLGLALWKIRVLVALLFFAFIIAAAMRPGIEALRRRGVPRGAGIAIHYIGFFALITGLLWVVVPRATEQVSNALGDLPRSPEELEVEASQSTGMRREILEGVQQRLEELPSASELVDPALEIGFLGFEILIGLFFVFASAAYWIFEREKAMSLVTSVIPRPRRKKVRDTWDLIDLKLGAYVRGQAILIAIVGTVLSLVFWAIGLPYWILIGVFAGIVEIVPVIGPLTAGAVAVGAGLTVSWQLGLAAGVTVLVVRLLEDYIVIPRVLGEAVGLSPLLVLFSITSVALLFGEFAVLLAIPLAAVLATLIDVIVRGKDPAEEDVPTVIFSPADSETA
ncbi:MAG: AI-2E family transporter [Gaiellaceae bacterium MAG52_C11]|nr:AI-2E family transporter [Candidatus Gaiellasilicea maunaloa]